MYPCHEFYTLKRPWFCFCHSAAAIYDALLCLGRQKEHVWSRRLNAATIVYIINRYGVILFYLVLSLPKFTLISIQVSLFLNVGQPTEVDRVLDVGTTDFFYLSVPVMLSYPGVSRGV